MLKLHSRKNKLFLVFLLMLFLWPGISLAYIEEGSNRLIVEVNPPFPSILEQATIEVKSFYYDLQTSTVRWWLNDKEVQAGPGQTSLLIRTGKLGQPVKVKLEVTVAGKIVATKSISFIPGNLDILTEPGTYTPPFYQGRPWPTAQSKVKIAAISEFFDANQNRILDNKIIYNWEVNGAKLIKSSGLGKNLLTISTGSADQKTEVTVTATALDGLVSAKRHLTLVSYKPEIELYKIEPLRGINYFTAIKNGETVAGDKDLTIVAEPFFVPQENLNGLLYHWQVGDKKTDTQNNPKILSILSDDQNISVDVSLTITGPKQLTEMVKSFIVSFAPFL